MKILLTLYVFLIILNYSFGQEGDTLTTDDYYVDFAVPDLSAMSLLGVDGDEIVRPGNVKELAAAITNFTDLNGNIKPAFAAEWAPFRTFFKPSNKSFNTFRNLTITLGTSEIDSLGLRTALGFKWVIFDESDPYGKSGFYDLISQKAIQLLNNNARTKIKSEFKESLNAFLKQHENDPSFFLNAKEISDLLSMGDSIIDIRCEQATGILLNELRLSLAQKTTIFTNAELDDILQIYLHSIGKICDLEEEDYLSSEIDNLISNEKKEWKNSNWNQLAAEISSGWVWHTVDGTFNDLIREKYSIFGSLAFPTFNRKGLNVNKGQSIFQLKFSFDASNDALDYNQFSAAYRFLYGGPDKRLSLDFQYFSSNSDFTEINIQESLSFLRYTIGGEFKLSDGNWLEIAAGGQKFFEGQDEKNTVLANFGFKHAFRSKPRFVKLLNE